MILFRSKFNYLFPLLRLILIVSILLIIYFLLYLSIVSVKNDSNYFVIVALILALGYIALVESIYLFRHSQSYIFREKNIEVQNKLTFNTRTITKEAIAGFYQSSIDYKGSHQKVIMIVLKNQSKLVLLQSNYLNFKEMESYLMDSKIPYLGEKEFSWTYIE